MEHVKKIASQFATQMADITVSSYGSGNVNDTYLIAANAGQNGLNQQPQKRFILQRINQQVFQQPEFISLNLRCLTEHAKQRLASEQNHTSRNWCFPEIIPTINGQDYVVDEQGDFWRCQSFVEEAVTHPQILDAAHAQEAGYALGRFHHLISDLSPADLHDTLEGFHITPRYLHSYDEVRQKTTRDLSQHDVTYALEFIEKRRAYAGVLEEAAERGDLVQRAIHGDPKVDNILIHTSTGQAVSIIDLDTVKPGLVQYDIGDCLRSCCNPLGEETDQFDAVHFDINLCRTILAGYLPIAREFFSAADYDYVYDSVRLIAFELGLRFFTDYLNGNIYFKVKDDAHNLRRALVQFRLAESIEAQQPQIQAIIDDLR